MPLRSRVALVAPLLLLIAPMTSPADAAPQRCGALDGTTVLATAKIRIVSRKVRRIEGDTRFVGRVFRGCAPPGGRVRALGRSGTIVDRETGISLNDTMTRFTRPRGTFVLRHVSSGNQQVTEASGEIVSVATGRRTLYFDLLNDGYSTISQAPFCDTLEPLALRLDATGRFAAVYQAYDDAGNELHTVEAFTPAGARKALDVAPAAEIDPAALRLRAGTVTWSRGSAAITADTPAYAPGTAEPDCS